MSTQELGEAFENKVRTIARELWPSAQYSGSSIQDGKERDAIFETEESVHIIEATTSRAKAKAENDIEKLIKLGRKLRSKNKAVNCWFITQDEPTADQRSVAEKAARENKELLIKALGIRQFEGRLIAAEKYLDYRADYRFGSARDPETGSHKVSDEYIPLELSSIDGTSREIANIVSHILAGKHCIIMGEYGAGKSMTLRYIHMELERAFRRHDQSRFPIYLNLRDHHGQDDPAEMLERHARRVGFNQPLHLVRAWRAGRAILIIDGFDELSGLGLQASWRSLSKHRYESMELIRSTIDCHPDGCGLILAGRRHYFDSDTQRRRALGLRMMITEEFFLNQFTEQQVVQYLRNKNLLEKLPEWIPSRPLLLAYLATKRLFPVVAESGLASIDPADGWDHLIELISEREAEIEAGIDPPTIRRLLERLATVARSSTDGLHPLTNEVISDAFRDVCGYSPDGRAIVVLERLPGLGIANTEDGSRTFVDSDLADALRAGDARRFIDHPFGVQRTVLDKVECPLGELGIAILAKDVLAKSVSSRQLDNALDQASNDNVKFDVVRAAFEANVQIQARVHIRDIFCSEFDLPNAVDFDSSMVDFQDCYFTRVDVPRNANVLGIPNFSSCMIGLVDCLSKEIFEKHFTSCEIENFSSPISTTDSVLDSDFSMPIKVLLTMLQKLYLQRGAGRKENALLRGLDHRGERVAADVLAAIESEGYANMIRRNGDSVWIPDRSLAARVNKIIQNPLLSTESLVRKCREIE